MPTLMQVRALAHFDGHGPCSYLLDPKVSHVPERSDGCFAAAARATEPVLCACLEDQVQR